MAPRATPRVEELDDVQHLAVLFLVVDASEHNSRTQLVWMHRALADLFLLNMPSRINIYDAMEQLLLVARGTKTLRLACPRDASRLDLGNAPLFNKCRLDAGGGSVFAALDAAANPVDVTLAAGDLLYLPAFWWHAVRSEDASTTLNYWFALHPDKAADA